MRRWEVGEGWAASHPHLGMIAHVRTVALSAAREGVAGWRFSLAFCVRDYFIATSPENKPTTPLGLYISEE